MKQFSKRIIFVIAPICLVFFICLCVAIWYTRGFSLEQSPMTSDIEDYENQDLKGVDLSVYKLAPEDQLTISDSQEIYDFVNNKSAMFECQARQMEDKDIRREVCSLWERETSEIIELSKDNFEELNGSCNNLQQAWQSLNTKNKQLAMMLYHTNSFDNGSMYVDIAFEQYKLKNELFYLTYLGLMEESGVFLGDSDLLLNDCNNEWIDFSDDIFLYTNKEDFASSFPQIITNTYSSEDYNREIYELCERIEEELHNTYGGEYDMYNFNFITYGNTFVRFNNILSDVERMVCDDATIVNRIYTHRQKLFLSEICSLKCLLCGSNSEHNIYSDAISKCLNEYGAGIGVSLISLDDSAPKELVIIPEGTSTQGAYLFSIVDNKLIQIKSDFSESFGQYGGFAYYEQSGIFVDDTEFVGVDTVSLSEVYYFYDRDTGKVIVDNEFLTTYDSKDEKTTFQLNGKEVSKERFDEKMNNYVKLGKESIIEYENITHINSEQDINDFIVNLQ